MKRFLKHILKLLTGYFAEVYQIINLDSTLLNGFDVARVCTGSMVRLPAANQLCCDIFLITQERGKP